MNNEEIYHQIKDVSDISVNVFMLNPPDFSQYDKVKQEILLDSKVYIKGKINDENYHFEFKAKTPKKEITISWLINLIKKDYLNTLKLLNKDYDKSKDVEIVNKVFKFKLGYSWYYVTEYGIGMQRLFLSPQFEKVLSGSLADFLDSEKVKFTNELSDANWVLRFKISNDFEYHNKLLEKFKQMDLKLIEDKRTPKPESPGQSLFKIKIRQRQAKAKLLLMEL